MNEKIYLQGDDALWLILEGYCEVCLSSARDWAEEDRFGNIEVAADLDREGNLVGFICPSCRS